MEWTDDGEEIEVINLLSKSESLEEDYPNDEQQEINRIGGEEARTWCEDSVKEESLLHGPKFKEVKAGGRSG